MSFRLLLALPFLLGLCSAQVQPIQSPHRPPSAAQIDGFRGPIQTSKYTVRQLEKDPRSQPKLPIGRLQKGWIAFDESGQVSKEGDLDLGGKVEHLVRRYYSVDGQQNTTEVIDGQKITRYDQETVKSPDGAVEYRNMVNGTLQAAVVARINEARTGGETTVADPNGKTIIRTRWEQDGRTQTVESWGPDGKFVLHSQVTTDDDGNVIESGRFDETGRLVSTMSFYQGELTSFWQDPECNCTNTAAFLGKDGSTIFYSTDKAGTLYKEVQRHPGSSSNQELDQDELYDQNGELVEKIAYTYVRDEHGNWTTRTVSVLD
ncbi:MAG TPA: hypothetical protein VFY05_11795, partial [Candidatus Angelobacter sp.]|nr:hypothetical protein [Candidatus Angelobacter sp.]